MFKKILIVNTFGIGDVLFTTPLISNLKASWPDVFIGYLANKRTAPLLERNPKINKVFIYERDDFKEVYDHSKVTYVKKVSEFFNQIKHERFDCAIDLSLQSSTSFFLWFLRIPYRIGFNYKNRSPLLTTKIEFKGYEDKHVVEYYLDLLSHMDLPIRSREIELPLSQDDLTWAEEFLQKNGSAPSLKIVALVPGGGASWGKDASYKRWPYSEYAKLADKIIEKFSAAIILMGGQEEQELCAQVEQSMSHKPLWACGKTSIGQMAALLNKCSLAIVNDGGPLHVAVAAGTRTISIFGPVNERVYGPYPPDNHVVVTKNIACRPCYRQFRRAQCDHISCLSTLNVEDVFRKVDEIL